MTIGPDTPPPRRRGGLPQPGEPGGGAAAPAAVRGTATPGGPDDPTSLIPALHHPAMMTATYGEPRFYTEGDVAALAFVAPESGGGIRTVDETGVLKHWTLEGRLTRRDYLSDLETVWAFAPGGGRLASGNDDLILWDCAAGSLAARIPQDTWVSAIYFGPGGAQVACGLDSGVVAVYDAQTFAELGRFDASGAAISALAIDPAGRYLATAAEDRVVRVFALADFAQVGEYTSHTDRVPALAWSSDGNLLVSAGWDTSARVWKPGQSDPLILLNSHAEQVHDVAFSPAGNLLAAVDSDLDITLWADPVAGKVGRVLRGHTDEIRAVAFSPDGKLLASGGADRVVHLWDVASGQLLAGPSPQSSHGVALVPRPGGKLWLASSGGARPRLFDAATAEAIPLDLPSSVSVAASADGRWLVWGGADHTARLMDLSQTPPAVSELEATKPPVGSVAVSPDGSLVAHTSPTDGLVWLWPTSGGEAKLILIEAADGCTLETLAFHPDGTRVAVGGIDILSTGERDGAVCVWNLATQEKDATFDYGVTALAYDPAGRYLAGAGIENQVYLFDLATEELVFKLEGHTDKIHAVAFSPDGSYVVSGGADQTIRVWDALSGRLVVAREFDRPVLGLAFGPGGASLFAGNGDATLDRIDFARLIND